MFSSDILHDLACPSPSCFKLRTMPGRAPLFWVSLSGIHMSLVICVRGYTYHRDTHITSDMCAGIYISRGYIYYCDTDAALSPLELIINKPTERGHYVYS